jgi:hypothetical protein
LGFGTTIAEPALIAVANEAANVAQLGGLIQEIELQPYAIPIILSGAKAVVIITPK